MVDQRVHDPDVHGEGETLAVAAHRPGLSDGNRPLLGFAETSASRVPGESTRLDQQVGRPAVAIAVDQRQLQQHVGGSGAEAAQRPATGFEEIRVDPVRHLVDDGEELAQRCGGVGDAVDSGS
ncbi:hypothetical protein [Rhodococcus triatomae]|uniref:hypothetical protein n=1 Tax=Rhodococcus triatomae TaxID=300028 RepID=UPI002892B58A|nr:hypothetical protein [Rhodococcus triatomae]